MTDRSEYDALTDDEKWKRFCIQRDRLHDALETIKSKNLELQFHNAFVSIGGIGFAINDLSYWSTDDEAYSLLVVLREPSDTIRRIALVGKEALALSEWLHENATYKLKVTE